MYHRHATFPPSTTAQQDRRCSGGCKVQRQAGSSACSWWLAWSMALKDKPCDAPHLYKSLSSTKPLTSLSRPHITQRISPSTLPRLPPFVSYNFPTIIPDRPLPRDDPALS